jgi:hypothetical protein
MRFLSHFERSEAESRNLFFNRFLHFGPLCGPPVEMTKAHILILIDYLLFINSPFSIPNFKFQVNCILYHIICYMYSEFYKNLRDLYRIVFCVLSTAY